MMPLRVSLEGFLSYQEKQTIDFDGSSLWMLWGPNGAGKSAVFDAITIALFNTHRAGSASRNAKELINHYADSFIIEFDFMVDDKAYRIRRTCARNGSPTRGAFLLQKNDLKVPIPDTMSDSGLKEWVTRTIGLDYQAFTSSVLLLQGKSEQLLNAEPKGRYEILAELIDLSRYQRLHEVADTQRKKYVGKKEALEQQLGSAAVRRISDEEIYAIRSELQQVNEEWQRVQAEVRQLAGLLEQAKQWEQETDQLEKQRIELQKVLDVLAREDEITRNFTELQVLRKVLPSLGRILEQRELILKKIQLIMEMQDAGQYLEVKLHEAENKQKDTDERLAQLDHTLADLRSAKEQYSDQLVQLSPLVEQLKQIEELQDYAEQLETDLAHFPTDIAQCFEETEQQAHSLASKNEVLPWLRTFAQARTDFSRALGCEQSAGVQTSVLHEQLHERKNERGLLDTELTEASQGERRLLGEKARAETRYNDAIEHLTNFENAAMKPICELCGQKLTEDHVQREKERLLKQIDEIKQTYEELTELYQKAQDQLQNKKQELATLDVQIKDLMQECSLSDTQQQQAISQSIQQMQQLRNAHSNIRSPYKERIIASAPAEDTHWLTTVYPTEADLEELKQELEGKSVHENYLRNLRQEFDQWRDLNGQKKLVQQQLMQLTLSIDVERAEQAPDEKRAIERQRQTIDSDIQQQTQAYELERSFAQHADSERRRLEESFQHSHTMLEVEKATLREMERTLQLYEETLPGDWRMRISSLNAVELTVLEQRHSALASYEQWQEDLRSAHQSKTTCEQRIDELNERIASYPLEARRSVVEVHGELENKKGLLSQIDGNRSGMNQQLARMEKQQEQRLELEEHKREADRLSYLYKLLADLLGRNGLQLYLLRRAEKTIVELASRTLDGLSHGRMRLELLRDSDATATQTNRALDLVVYDCETGQHAIPIGLISGSQRFRIAVSLALAIGRYTSHEARHVESVIIDEGFGSLDKAGSDDMIQELNALRQQLSRIILVSHQDEFANAFSNRYSFKLVDGASYVSLMEDE